MTSPSLLSVKDSLGSLLRMAKIRNDEKVITLLERLEHNLNSVINENNQIDQNNATVDRISALLDRVETSLHSMISKADVRLYEEECFKCEKCGKLFRNNNELNLHRVRSKECEFMLMKELGDIYLCPEAGCGYKGFSLKNYKAHYYIHTDKYLCSICNHRFVRRIDLGNHLKKVHQEYQDLNLEEKEDSPKTYKCTEPYCTYKGSTLKNYKSHSVVHTDKYRCNGCNHRFVRRVDLVKHVQKKHILPEVQQ